MAAGTHYSDAFNVERMLSGARILASELNEQYPEATLVLVYTGFSGVSHATYLAAELHRIGRKSLQVYVRKEHEISHGEDVEYVFGSAIREDIGYSSENRDGVLFVFVDDFIASGSTLKRCVKELLGAFPGRGQAPCVVAVYDRLASSFRATYPYLSQCRTAPLQDLL